MGFQVEGRNPVLEALKSGRKIHELLLSEVTERGALAEILHEAERRQVPVRELGPDRLHRRSQTDHAQGVIAVMDPIPTVEVDALLDRAWSAGEDPFVIVAAEIQDPHNLGAILRTAEAAGCHGVVIPKHRAVGITTAVVKASAGAALYVPVAVATNLVRTVEHLKKSGLWIFAASMEGEHVLWEAPLTGPVALVIGSEGTGVPRLLLDKSDFRVAIPMSGQIGSLNASVAGGLFIFEVVRQRHTRARDSQGVPRNE